MTRDPTNSAGLPDRAERLLAEWPDQLLDDDRFERLALSIEAQLDSAPTSSSTEQADVELDWLLRAPLPLQTGEPQHWARSPATSASGSNVVAKASDPSSLRSIARAALDASRPVRETPQPRALPRLVPRARPALTPGSASPTGAVPLGARQTTDVAGPPGAGAVPPATSAAVPPAVPTTPIGTTPIGTTPIGTVPLASGESDVRDRVSAVRLVRTEVVPSSSRRSWVWPAATFAAAASILGMFTFGDPFGARHAEHASASNTAVAPPAATAPEPSEGAARLAAPGSSATDVAPEAHSGDPTTTTAQPSPAQPRAAQPSADLPGALAAEDLPTEPRRAAVARPAKPAAAVATPQLEAPPSQSAQAEATTPPPNTSGEAKETEAPLVPAAREPSQTERPSIGAAQVALGAVSGSARACLAGHFTPSKAAVVFGSDGRVREVQVTGPAQGTPAERCIVTAMSQARVRPFTDDSFTIRTTVRP